MCWPSAHDGTRSTKFPCRYKPVGTSGFEIPPFLLSDVVLGDRPWSIKTISQCACAKRKGLALLLSNREIHNHAFPILWSKNTFCFLDGWEFAIAVGHMLRPDCRDRLRSISVMSPDRTGHPRHMRWARGCKPSPQTDFWDVALQCTRLERLEIPPAYLKDLKSHSTGFHRITERLAHLQPLFLTQLIPFCRNDFYWEYPWPACHRDHPFTTYARCTRRLPCHGHMRGDDIIELCRDLEYNFRVHVDTAVKTRFLGVDAGKLHGWRDTFKLAPGLHEHSNTRRITLPSGETTTIKFYGLPVSKSTKIRIARNRMVLERHQRQLDGLSFAQHAEARRQRQLKKQERAEQTLRERQMHEELLAERRARRLGLRTAEIQAARARKELIRNSMKQSKEDRRKERKRVCLRGETLSED